MSVSIIFRTVLSPPSCLDISGAISVATKFYLKEGVCKKRFQTSQLAYNANPQFHRRLHVGPTARLLRIAETTKYHNFAGMPPKALPPSRIDFEVGVR